MEITLIFGLLFLLLQYGFVSTYSICLAAMEVP